MADEFIVRWRDVRAKIVDLLLYGNGSLRRGLAAHQDEQEGNKEDRRRKGKMKREIGLRRKKLVGTWNLVPRLSIKKGIVAICHIGVSQRLGNRKG
jgi:hypothetical protein